MEQIVFFLNNYFNAYWLIDWFYGISHNPFTVISYVHIYIFIELFMRIFLYTVQSNTNIAQSTVAIEYTDCTAAEGWELPRQRVSWIWH